MDNAQQPPTNKDDKNAPPTELQRTLNTSAASSLALSSWGERLLPFLFCVMEACWVDAILIGLASINFFLLHTPLVPLWSSFVLIPGACWIVNRLERRDEAPSRSVSSLVFGLSAIVALLLIWSSIYASSTSFFDPGWLLSLLNDILLLSPNAYHIVGVLIISFYFCWRGARLAHMAIEPTRIISSLRIGMGIFIAVIVMQVGTGTGALFSLPLLFLIPFFLCCSLVAHTLSRATFVKHEHKANLRGSVSIQERSLLTVVGAVGLVLLVIGLIIGAIVSPDILSEVQKALSPLGQVYDWLVMIIAYVITFLVTPLFWLISLIPKAQPFSIPPIKGANNNHVRVNKTTPEAVLAIIAVLKVVLPFVLLALIIFLFMLALRRRRIIRARLLDDSQDVRESIWSWELFLSQLKALLRGLFRRFFPAPGAPQIASESVEIHAEPSVRTIREIYRALLKWAEGFGVGRKKHETPHEFQHRLDEQFPQAEPQLSTVTDAYNAIRYGGVIPDEAEVALVRQVWQDLQEKVGRSDSI